MTKDLGKAKAVLHTFMLGNISGKTLCHAAMIALKRCNLLLRVTSSMSCTSVAFIQSPSGPITAIHSTLFRSPTCTGLSKPGMVAARGQEQAKQVSTPIDVIAGPSVPAKYMKPLCFKVQAWEFISFTSRVWV